MPNDAVLVPSVSVASETSVQQVLLKLAKHEAWSSELFFYLNGNRVVLQNPDPEATVLEYIRAIGLTGTKRGCEEGGCGSCTVIVAEYDKDTKKVYHASINACIAPLVFLDGKHLITVEALGTHKNPHPAQERIAKLHGSQCGFCTPGFVMSLYATLRNNPEPSEHELEEAFDGNLCRCTGYRPILDAARTFAKGADKGCAMGDKCCKMGGTQDACGSSLETNPPTARNFPPVDFKPYDPTTELLFPPALKKYEPRALYFGNERKYWFRPVTVDTLLDIKAIAGADAKITGGSSEIQIEIKFKNLNYNLSVYAGEIKALKQIEFHDNHITVGANATLTDVEYQLDEPATKRYGETRAQSFAAIVKQLKYFAGRQIRNVGTPAGALATASPISDLNPLLMALGAKIFYRCAGQPERALDVLSFFTGYRRTALPADGVLTRIEIPVLKEQEFARSYKQSKRKDDDIAIVTSGMRVRLAADNTVEEIGLAYGGMAATTVMALKTQAFLMGKRWTDKDVLEQALNTLGEEFDLPFGVPGGMATFRKSLAIGFFYRFHADVCQQLGTELDAQAVAPIERGLMKSWRDHEVPVQNTRIVGKPLPHVAAMRQVTGQAQYTDDFPAFANQLYGCMVWSTKAHAKVLAVDASAALALPGVTRWISASDIREGGNLWGDVIQDEPYLAEAEVFCHGQPIGMILADTYAQARLGAQAVGVKYTELPAILTCDEAIAADSFHPYQKFMRCGLDMDEAFAQCDHVIEGEARMGGQEQFYLETQACVTVPRGDDEFEIFTGTQNPTFTQLAVAELLGLGASRVNVRVNRMGGAFGGKESRSVQLAAITSLAASVTQRPVRCMLDRDSDMISTGQRNPYQAKWKAGIKDGKVFALDGDITNNAGWSLDLSGATMDRCLSHIENCYTIPNVHVRGRCAKTNIHSNTAFRGFGAPQGSFIAETIMETIADKLKMDVHQLRCDNLSWEGHRTPYGQELIDWHMPRLWTEVLKEAEYEKRKQAIEEFNKSSKWKKRGIAIVPVKHGISFGAMHYNQAGALVHVYKDGNVLLAHGGTEMGQGLNTKMIQVCAEELGIPFDQVFVSETSTNTVANTSPTAASAGSDLNGAAIKNACDQIMERLKPFFEADPEASFKQIVKTAYYARVNLSANGHYKTPDIAYVWGSKSDEAKPLYSYFTQAVGCSEVEIDCLTGDWTLLRTDLKMDIGRSINPAIDYGQVEGAFVQGTGLFTIEESLWTRHNGQLFTKGPGAYKIPGARDIPQDFRVSFLKKADWANLKTIQSSKGIGEPGLALGLAPFFALRDAVKRARLDSGDDTFLEWRSPATTERIRCSLSDDIIKAARVLPKDGEQDFFVSLP
ncbi:Molybdopterin-binding domain of aldehyde dehydrogenase-domain-containing protein [Protomyces lactucae-debilis]|uniref:Molybdopterin-binding domain of aldehyde dehydrogenase-domain-containing protein n=1 Tax=Protomyces lactucae-debilis TaxID=2754530 RepID=A0A1Y2F1M7_PROLT|nr:Molybdopterin-binding domain of aldehyde dehydrogenase-domain-containing protein [Protomyces lactucae-debilis]ORY77778.1 Molybdopterin-binding domain of aldehyde dehydrogenase-domain-containing protein [Protomyces lactucae-debilis]